MLCETGARTRLLHAAPLSVHGNPAKVVWWYSALPKENVLRDVSEKVCLNRTYSNSFLNSPTSNTSDIPEQLPLTAPEKRPRCFPCTRRSQRWRKSKVPLLSG